MCHVQWAAPTRAASLLRSPLTQGGLSRPASVARSNHSHHSPRHHNTHLAGEHSRAITATSSYTAAQYGETYGETDEYGEYHHHADDASEAAGPRGEAGEASGPASPSALPPVRRKARPDIITTRSPRLLELFQEGQARLAAKARLMSHEAAQSPKQARSGWGVLKQGHNGMISTVPSVKPGQLNVTLGRASDMDGLQTTFNGFGADEGELMSYLKVNNTVSQIHTQPDASMHAHTCTRAHTQTHARCEALLRR